MVLSLFVEHIPARQGPRVSVNPTRTTASREVCRGWISAILPLPASPPSPNNGFTRPENAIRNGLETAPPGSTSAFRITAPEPRPRPPCPQGSATEPSGGTSTGSQISTSTCSPTTLATDMKKPDPGSILMG